MYYAGIGSRRTPNEILKEMTVLGKYYAKKNCILRSGGAKGADTAFEKGALEVGGKVEIFKHEDSVDQEWTIKEVEKAFPLDRDFKTFKYWKPYIQGLIKRNMMQILGKDGESPVKCVICWTPLGDPNYESATKSGGTVYALRLAKAYGIPIYNLNKEGSK